MIDENDENKDRLLRITFERLNHLRAQVQSTKPEDAHKEGHPGSGLGPLVTGYKTLLARVQELTDDDPVADDILHDLPPVHDVSKHISAAYHVNAKHQLLFGIDALLKYLESRLLASTGAPANVSVEREGLFVAGRRFDALRVAGRILATATREIILVDGFIDDKVPDLMSTKPENVPVKILTKAWKLPGNIKAFAAAFNEQYGKTAPLAIRTSGAFHDRFLVIDDTDFYHFGASLKDLGKKGFMFSRIEEPAVVNLLRASFASEWDNAKPVV